VIGITPIFIVTEISLQSVLCHRIIAPGYDHELTSLQIVHGRYCLLTLAHTKLPLKATQGRLVGKLCSLALQSCFVNDIDRG
jgi:hypothetical protein